MARGGINKANVIQARQALRAKGINPSIDALRVELGNTGSRSTIQRLLRELEQEEGAQLDDETLLSETVLDLVRRLAGQLRGEAKGLIEQAIEQHKRERQQWHVTDSDRQRELVALRSELERAQSALEGQQLISATLQSTLRDEQTQGLVRDQQITDLTERLAENQGHRDSLEAKHEQARLALEHFREAAKEQREQAQLRQEQQVQSLQAEIRQLNQALAVKQTDITVLNKDNARLTSELGSTQKQLIARQTICHTLEASATSARDKTIRLEGKLIQAEEVIAAAKAAAVADQITRQDLSERIRELEIQFAKVEVIREGQDATIADLQSRLTSYREHVDR